LVFYLTGHNIKTIFNFFLALTLILIFLPLMIFISLLILIETGQFPIFKQLRGITLSNQKLYIYKFLTLKSKSYNLKSSQNGKLEHRYLNSELTFIGKIIRRMGLDELPQLFNVLKGDMNLMGPRPLVFEDLEYIKKYYPEIYELRDKLNSKPGITGLWQINRNGEFSVKSLIYWDLYYEKEHSLLLDLKILLKTFLIIIQCKHSDAISENKLKLNYSLIFFLTYFALVSFISLSLIQLIK